MKLSEKKKRNLARRRRVFDEFITKVVHPDAYTRPGSLK